MPGRNDPCPCGSGKKYKKCCLSNDLNIRHRTFELEQAERVERELEKLADHAATPVTSPELKPVAPPDPRMEAIDARWNEFVNEDKEGFDRVFVKTLDDPELMDAEMAFGMLETIYSEATEPTDFKRFLELLDLLRSRLPEIYRANRNDFLRWQIQMALAGFQSERLMEFTKEVAETAGEDVDNYLRIVNQLAYHGQLAAISEASRIAWPFINESDEILWGQEEFAQWGTDCAIFQRLESSKTVDGRDAQLIEQVEFYFKDLQLDEFAQYVARLNRWNNRPVSLEDFKSTKKDSGSSTRAISHLTDEFVAYAHQQEGIPYTKAALAMRNILKYLTERRDGNLEPSQTVFQAMRNPQKKRKHKPMPNEHPLCPDRGTLDRYLASFLNIAVLDYHNVAATFELMPTWLRFLEARGLIDSYRRASTLTDIRDLQKTLLELWNTNPRGRVFAENFEKWPENAARPLGTVAEPS